MKWKFDDETLLVNPTNFLLPSKSGATYVKLVDGSEVRISPESNKMENVTIVWANVNMDVVIQVEAKLGKKVKVTTHNGEVFDLYFDDIDREELRTSRSGSRFSLRVTAREA